MRAGIPFSVPFLGVWGLGCPNFLEFTVISAGATGLMGSILGFGLANLGFRVCCAGSEVRVWGLGFRVSGSGFRV